LDLAGSLEKTCNWRVRSEDEAAAYLNQSGREVGCGRGDVVEVGGVGGEIRSREDGVVESVKGLETELEVA